MENQVDLENRHDIMYAHFPSECEKVARQFTGGEITSFEVIAWVVNYLQELEAMNAREVK